MKRTLLKNKTWVLILLVFLTGCDINTEDPVERGWKARIKEKGLRLTLTETGRSVVFHPHFTILVQRENPNLALRPGNIPGVRYNVPTWENPNLDIEDYLGARARDEAQVGDGFNDRVLEGNVEKRTANVFRAGKKIELTPKGSRIEGNRIFYEFSEQEAFLFSASIEFNDSLPFPRLSFELKPKQGGYFSVGYTGAPAYDPERVDAIWQPLLWQERRFPHQSFLTLAYRCPLPTTLTCQNGQCVGVVADPEEFPFMPLPLADNSRFGVVLRSETGEARPALFAPVMGGSGSLMEPGDPFQFRMYLYAGAGTDTDAYEEVASRIYQFRDYRNNALGPLNTALDNMIDYGMSEYSWYIDSLKGCAYSTDVPGAVKNVSGLNPLQVALITDREDIYWERAYPIMEYLLSREKFLFSLDPEQKIQHPSRAMRGPAAPLSELTTLYNISGKKSSALLSLAKEEYGKDRARNLDNVERGDRWQNALALYEATEDRAYLKRAVAGAHAYLTERRESFIKDFTTEETDYFFWTAFTNDWINLLRLYEETGDRELLEAAHEGARHYTQFVWLSPRIPQTGILVNEGGQAPLYWYLKSKGHLPMPAPEEEVPAWRLSAIGLTPESSSTCNGHRGIFMANYAPWMLRLAEYMEDDFLKAVARSAIIGRYTNFPGYHINTARTTVYEKPDYPLRPHKELSVNSFHYNHIWPHMSILVDYLATDAFLKSGGAIDFPGDFIEGYAYLQSRFYGHQPGRFFDVEEAWLWMPQGLLTTSSGQLNYLSARSEDGLLLAFMNQSSEEVSSVIQLDENVVPLDRNKSYALEIWKNDGRSNLGKMEAGAFSIEVPAEGMVAVLIKGLEITPRFQQKLQGSTNNMSWRTDYLEGKVGDSRFLMLNPGIDLQTAYFYLREDDNLWRSVEIEYEIDDRGIKKLTDRAYPFEFTIDLPADAAKVAARVIGQKHDGKTETGQWLLLEK